MFQQIITDGGVSAPEGFFSSGVSAGLKNDEKLDLGFIYSDKVANVGAVFTSNKFKASPLKHYIQNDIKQTNFILANSKNANAMTGEKGISDIEEILQEISKKLPIENPIMSSTGVIGVHLPVEKIIKGAEKFDLSKKESDLFAQSIMTTDAYKKEIAVKVILRDGREYSIGGVAKGAGMINPSMATMLAFITTDLDIPSDEIVKILREVSHTTFNAISVDGDTSTNDSVFLMANGKKNFYDEYSFKSSLKIVMEYLALQIVKDGEGAKKLAKFSIVGARTDCEAEKVAKTLSDSLLVKTALFGEDPNWGRIAMGIGASGAEVSEENLTIAYNDIKVYEKGKNLFDDEVEKEAFKVLQKLEFTINCDLGVGNGKFTSYGCDLGYEYVKINADYRT
jgi:glutamate N-acetyltransferase/amino-acid N-acetyltransferase